MTIIAAYLRSPFIVGNYPDAVTARPNGKFFYITNENDNQIRTFIIDQATGAITASGAPVKTGEHPISVNISPNGKFAYVANFHEHSVSAYTIDQKT